MKKFWAVIGIIGLVLITVFKGSGELIESKTKEIKDKLDSI